MFEITHVSRDNPYRSKHFVVFDTVPTLGISDSSEQTTSWIVNFFPLKSVVNSVVILKRVHNATLAAAQHWRNRYLRLSLHKVLGLDYNDVDRILNWIDLRVKTNVKTPVVTVWILRFCKKLCVNWSRSF